jgi:hypothetical protein
LATIDFFCITHNLNSTEVIEKWEMSRVLQIMHAATIKNGRITRWSKYFDPPQHIMDDLYSNNDIGDGWDILEPEKL